MLKGLKHDLHVDPVAVIVAVDKAAANGDDVPVEAWKLRGQAFEAVMHPVADEDGSATPKRVVRRAVKTDDRMTVKTRRGG